MSDRYASTVIMPQPAKALDQMEMLTCFNTAPVALLIATGSGEVIWANAAAGLLLARRCEYLVGCSLTWLLELDDLDNILAVSSETAAGPITLGVSTGTGDRIFIEVQATGSITEEGAKWLTVVLRDATDSQHAEACLRNELQRLEFALSGAGIGVFEIDLITGKSTVSDTWLAIMGVSADSLIDSQHLWLSRMHPDDRPLVEAADRDCIEGRSPQSQCTYRMRTADGLGWRWMRSDAIVASRDASGRATRLIGAQTDVTEQKEAEDALRLNAEESRSSFDNAPIAKAIVGLDGRWLRVNTVLCQLFGYSEQRLLETDFQTLTHPDDLGKDLDQVKMLIAGEKSNYRMEKRYVRSDGTLILADLSVAIVRDHAGIPLHFIAQILDVTEQRNLEQMKSQFVANVSHELRTPLTSILGALGLLEEVPDGNFSDEVSRLIFIARQNAERLRMRVKDILDFEGLTSGLLKLSLARERIVPLLETSLMNSLAFSQKYGVRIEMDRMDRNVVVLADADRFEQVMANLLSNAAKFAESGSIVRIGMTSSAKMVSIHVKNRGPAIPEKYRAVLFKPFAHVEKSSAQKQDGTGLGLSISKQIIEQMGGRIGFESEDGTTTFWFTLPLLSEEYPGAGPRPA
jgi:PAS domain S-box-containing protein